MQIQASLSGDEDGFLSRECPTCLGRFKAAISDGSVLVRFCPYCGHEGDDCWWTPEQLDYARALMLREIQPEMDAMFDGLSKPGGLISITVERSETEPPVMPVERNASEQRVQCVACGTEIKLDFPRLRDVEGRLAPFTCIECGAAQETPAVDG